MIDKQNKGHKTILEWLREKMREGRTVQTPSGLFSNRAGKTRIAQLKKKTIVIVTALAGAAMWVALRNKPRPRLDLPDAPLEYIESFEDHASCSGRPKPEDERYISVQKGGRLEALSIKVGDTVSAGQAIGYVDKTINASALKSALSNFRLAQKDFHRLRAMVESGAATREEFDKVQANLDVKKAELETSRQILEDSMLRATHSGRVSVVVFQVGDKVPDGGRVAAIEAPGSIQLTCRIPSPIADTLRDRGMVRWTLNGGEESESAELETSIMVAKSGAFVGTEREVRFATLGAPAAKFQGKIVTIEVSLPPRQGVAKLPSDAILRRNGGSYALIREAGDRLSWSKVEVLRRDGTTAFVTGLAKETRPVRITRDVHEIEKFMAAMANDGKTKGQDQQPREEFSR